jgi:hypothetical protein
MEQRLQHGTIAKMAPVTKVLSGSHSVFEVQTQSLSLCQYAIDALADFSILLQHFDVDSGQKWVLTESGTVGGKTVGGAETMFVDYG